MANYYQNSTIVRKKMVSVFGETFPEIEKTTLWPILASEKIHSDTDNDQKFSWVLILEEFVYIYEGDATFSVIPRGEFKTRLTVAAPGSIGFIGSIKAKVKDFSRLKLEKRPNDSDVYCIN